MCYFSLETLLRIWQKGSIVRGKDPKLYRRDCYGNIMYWSSYGKFTKLGWNVDHSKPIAKGGTNHLNNLQPMNCFANCSKNAKY